VWYRGGCERRWILDSQTGTKMNGMDLALGRRVEGGGPLRKSIKRKEDRRRSLVERDVPGGNRPHNARDNRIEQLLNSISLFFFGREKECWLMQDNGHCRRRKGIEGRGSNGKSVKALQRVREGGRE